MFFKNRIILETALLYGFLLHVCGQIKEGSNAKQYGILCDIYNVAANPPNSMYDANHVEKIKKKIYVIDASLSDDSWLGETSEKDTNGNVTGELKGNNSNGASNWHELKHDVASVASNYTGFQNILSTKTFVSRAQRKLKKIVSQMEKVIKNVQEANTAANLDGIKKDFEAVIGKIGEQTTKEDRVALCGNPSNNKAGTSAGKFLILDFLCLCARPCISDKLPNVCGPDIKENRWDKTTGDGRSDEKGEETWKILKEGCENRGSTKLADPNAGYVALGEFLTAVSQDTVTTYKDKPGIFGSVYNQRGSGPTGGCTGRGGEGHGACLYYGNNGKDGGRNIPWVQKFKSGLEKLKKFQNITASVQSDIMLLKMLQIRAEEIHEDTKAILELEKSNHEEATSHSATLNHSYHISLFFPWSLLI
ncbi:Variant surface glycoprotein [Trypanosoma congolense IL3000]|uniref:Variant surface glycoprotein n=1 Tax=Trypanosoma congolense (strain IL3000) TaxID=1068625 RepID=F9W4U6_TRYCI|nr:Variant surface glycoprotein [Trypanosoma congolense IL3000]